MHQSSAPGRINSSRQAFFKEFCVHPINSPMYALVHTLVIFLSHNVKLNQSPENFFLRTWNSSTATIFTEITRTKIKVT